MKILKAAIAFLFLLSVLRPLHAQQRYPENYETVCPAGYTLSNLPGSNSLDPITGLHRAIICISPITGDIVFGASSSSTPNQNSFYLTASSCGTLTHCLQLNDNNLTDNCGTPLTTFIASFNAYSGPGSPVLDFEDNGAIGGAFKFSSCNIVVLVNSTVIINATINVASSLDNWLQIGPSGRSAYGTDFIYVNVKGTGTIIGGASLTNSGIHVEKFEGTVEISGLHFFGFGAGNATLGNCTNYAMAFDTDSEEDVHDTWWYLSDSDMTLGRCILYDVDNSSGGGQDTARIYGNHWAAYVSSALNACGSEAIVEGGTSSTIDDNSIAGFAIPVRLQSLNATNGGFVVSHNAFDAQGCTAHGVSAEIHLGGAGLSGLLSNITITSNEANAGAGHATNLVAPAGDTTQTFTNINVSNNVANLGTNAMAVAPSTMACTGTNICNQEANENMSLGGSNGSWFGPSTPIVLSTHTSQVANFVATTIFTSNASTGFLFSCTVSLLTSGTGSTIPACQVTYANALAGGASTTLVVTPTTTSVTVGASVGNSVRIVVQGASAIQISTTGYVSGSYGFSAALMLTQ